MRLMYRGCQALRNMPILRPMQGESYTLWLKEQARRRAEIKKLRRAGKSLGELARIFGVSRGRIYQIVKPDGKS